MKKILDSMERFQWATQRGFNPISTMTGTQYETFHNMKYTANCMQHEFKMQRLNLNWRIDSNYTSISKLDHHTTYLLSLESFSQSSEALESFFA